MKMLTEEELITLQAEATAKGDADTAALCWSAMNDAHEQMRAVYNRTLVRMQNMRAALDAKFDGKDN